MSECQIDGAKTGDGATLCGKCAGELREALADLADLVPMLTDVAARMTAQGPRTGTIKRTGHGDGVSVHPLDVADEVRAVVTPWVRMLVEEGVIASDCLPERLDNGPADTAALCGHLASRVSVIRLSDVAADFARDILEAGQSLCIGNNDPDVPDTAPHYPPGEFVLAGRPALVEMVRQVIGMDGNAPSITTTVGDRMDEAMQTFMAPDLARALVVEGGVKVSERQVERWIAEDRMLVRRDMEGRAVSIMPSSLVELAASVKRGRRKAA